MIGQKIHSYEIVAHLGKGGMGEVFKAVDNMLGREVALKMLHPQLTMQPQFLERFKKEARILAQLHHPNIAVIYNFIEQENNHFMVMEYVDGTNLDDLLKKYRVLPAEFIVPVFIQVLEGLQHAHRKNIFHRDIKPANIMLTPDGTIKLMDFGIAKVAGEQKMTQVNKIVGTVEFMAPELIQGKDASASSDIYATGVALYELLTGKLPIEGDTDFNLMHAILKQKVTQPGKYNNTIPQALSNIIMKALDKNPANRYADAKTFQQALIAAFPNYNNANLIMLQTAAPAAFANQASPATRIEKATNAAMETRAEIWAKPLSVFDSFKQNVLKNKRIYSLAALLLLVLFITIAIVKNTGPAGGGGTGSDSTGISPQNNSGGGIAQNHPAPPPVDNGDNKTTPVEEKRLPEKPKENSKENIVEKKKKENIQKDEEPVKEKENPVAPKEIIISSDLEINLYLENDLSNAAERTDIPVRFSLTAPVVYGGVTIINRGATASGVIKLGKIQTDVDINSITAANGQQIRLKADRGHGRRNEITSKRNYTAIILRGTRLTF